MLRSGYRARTMGWTCQKCGWVNGEDDFNCDSDECRRARVREEREETKRMLIDRRRIKQQNQRLRDALVEHDVAMFAITGRTRVFDANPQRDALSKWRGN